MNIPYLKKLSFRKNKLPIILQSESTECALACLAMIVNFYGYSIDLISLRYKYSVSSLGLNLKSLIDIADKLKFSTRPIQVKLEDLTKLSTPLILHWDLNHYVVLKKINSRYAIIHDPAKGIIKVSIEDLSSHFTGIAVEIFPSPEFIPQKDKILFKLNQLWSNIVGLKRTLIYIFILAFILQFFAIISPFYMQIVIDEVILSQDLNLLVVLAIGFSLLLIFQLIVNTLREYVILNFSTNLNYQLALNLFKHLVRLPMSYFYKRHIGDIVSRFSSLDTIRRLIANNIIVILVDGLLASLTLIIMFLYSIKLTFIVIISLLLYTLLRLYMYQPIKALTEEQILSKSYLDTNFLETVRVMQTIKVHQGESDRTLSWQNKMVDLLNKTIQLEKWSITYNALRSLFTGLENILVIYYGAIAVTNDILSVGMLFAFINYKIRFQSSYISFIDKLFEFRMIELHLQRLADIVYTKLDPLTLDNNSLQNINLHESNAQNQPKSIEVKNLSFRYSDSDPFVFENLNFTLKAEESIAIIGSSGCGKTTLLKCLMGFLKQTSGEILISGEPLESNKHYLSQIGSIMQDDNLLTGSLLENIGCFSHKINFEMIVKSAKIASIHNDIEKMPLKYHTPVGDMGTFLSSGQIQRIFLARALYRNPSVLFLDEATSHLDISTENKINLSLCEMKVTKVIVAHRPQTIETADKVYDMNICGYVKQQT